ncbi:hypothetical protein [Psychrobacillus antarcticus]|uniref:hypothetical protein n=1 Tax=Psychrobacillus antarcticus TaxID=2879115 RepID=UPI0024083526|nr:hypothetical protein [Psychrobacillus antarcticus]
MLGSIEVGGTKLNCAIGDEQGNINKQFLNTPQHPEMGHITIIRDTSDIKDSDCPFHTNCFEG